jgi:hypothetical protein
LGRTKTIHYPETKGETVDQYFDAKVADRMLVRRRSLCRNCELVKAENEVTYGYLNQIFAMRLKPHGETVELRKNRLTFQRRKLYLLL